LPEEKMLPESETELYHILAAAQYDMRRRPVAHWSNVMEQYSDTGREQVSKDSNEYFIERK